MKKTLLLAVIFALISPVMAETTVTTTTTTTREFVPFTEAIDRAKLQQEADMRASRQTLEQQRTEVQNKINTQKEAYSKQQQKQSQKRAELKKQNELKKQEIQRNYNSVREGVYTVKRNVVETPEQIRKNNALDFTNLKNAVNQE